MGGSRTELEVTGTNILTRRRPFVALADVYDENGVRYQGVGASYLTRGRATDKAIATAKELAEKSPYGVTVGHIDYRSKRIAFQHDSDGSYEWETKEGFRNFYLPPFRVNVALNGNGKSIDGEKSSWMTVGRALRRSVKSAEKRIQAI